MTKSIEQTQYLAAKYRYDTIQDAVKALMQPHEALAENDETLEEYCLIEEGFCSTLGAYEASQELRIARDALIAWGHEAVKGCKEYTQHQAMLAEMFSKVQRHPAIRERLVALLLKIDASSIKKVKVA